MPALRIDVQAHYFGGVLAGPSGKRLAPGANTPWTAQATLEAMQRADTAVQVLSVLFSPRSEDGVDARVLARRINE
jgi:hypothetical protein